MGWMPWTWTWSSRSPAAAQPTQAAAQAAAATAAAPEPPAQPSPPTQQTLESDLLARIASLTPSIPTLSATDLVSKPLLPQLPPLSSMRESPGTSPYTAWAAGTLCLTTAAVSAAGRPGYPSAFPLALFGLVFGGAGYMTLFDTSNGPSTAAAWGVLYMILGGPKTLKNRKLLPLTTLAGVTASTVVHLQEVFE
ncbi:hypothetical protein BC831DRAFT_551068 [Entophlyctis helioformis]|nr:hypothetical protein BC831DRAFT_551068 [Entophlyctis helioformis]